MYRIGVGVDTHILVEGRPFMLGGVRVPFEKGLLGHSDGDVAIHAIIDALLGALGDGDIGKLFPDTDPTYKNIDSKKLLQEVALRVAGKGYAVENIDVKIICQKPKLASQLPKMARVVAGITNCNNANVGATTTEGMNDEGRGFCVSAHAVALLRRVGEG